jgi:uncharacterized phage protein (TIGR01671 family)
MTTILEEIDKLKSKIADLEKRMQFTGLKDKNGVEIFEGDILRSALRAKDVPDLIVSVRWCFDKTAWVVDYLSKNNIKPSLLSEWPHWEMIGNIYENPELLED